MQPSWHPSARNSPPAPPGTVSDCRPRFGAFECGAPASAAATPVARPVAVWTDPARLDGATGWPCSARHLSCCQIYAYSGKLRTPQRPAPGLPHANDETQAEFRRFNRPYPCVQRTQNSDPRLRYAESPHPRSDPAVPQSRGKPQQTPFSAACDNLRASRTQLKCP